MAQPRRFNVAITRAQALVIVVGDPSVLGRDILWRAFLNYVYLGGGWIGDEPDWDPREPIEGTEGQGMEALQMMLQTMALAGENGENNSDAEDLEQDAGQPMYRDGEE